MSKSSLNLTQFENKVPIIDDLLVFCTENKCSDLYIKVGESPYISRWGMIHKVPSFPVTSVVWNQWAKQAITSENNAKYVRQKMLDLSYIVTKEYEENGIKQYKDLRYRVSAGFSMGKNIATFRMISEELPSLSKINFPIVVRKILEQIMSQRQGITLFVGVTGSGKTTSLAACLNDFTKPNGPMDNSTIISLEDPIEYIIPSSQSVNILQKELGTDFKNFYDGVKQSLREHPTFINVGETRDRETVETLVEAARTGHGVISSFHASDCADAISRIYNMLVGLNEDIMYDVITNMNFILCQRLIPSPKGFKLNTQYMVFTDEIKNYLSLKVSKGENIPRTIGVLFKDPKLLSSGLIKDWD